MLLRLKSILVVSAVAAVLLAGVPVFSADWPTWRHDPGRTAATDEELPATLHPQWVRKFPPLRPTWPDAPRVLFDAAYEPVVLTRTMFVCLPHADKVMAFDTGTGAERWSFFAEAPVRFAPVAWKDRVFVGSDDGYLYCLDAGTGRMLWRFRGGPSERKVIGHDRLISTWPVSSGPVLVDDTIYFSTGIWPFMDVFYHALDAASGKVVWVNDGTSILFRAMPKGHSTATALSGPTPQGYAVVAGDRLLIPCGRSLPACFDRRTGKFLYYEPTAAEFYGRDALKTNTFVSGTGGYFFNGKGVFDVADGKLLRELPGAVGVATAQVVFSNGAAWDHHRANVEIVKDWAGHDVEHLNVPKMYDLPAGNVRLKAGSRLYLDVPGRIFAVDLPTKADGKPEAAWTFALNGTVQTMLAADGRLFVVTAEGEIHCFGPEKVERFDKLTAPSSVEGPKTLEAAAAPLPVVRDEWTARVADILRQTGREAGYAVVLGVDSGRLVAELVRQSTFHVIGIGSDAAKIDALRRRFDAAGLYGIRISLHVGDPTRFEPFDKLTAPSSVEGLPPYFARLIVSEDAPAADAAFVKKVFRSLRPYGGLACFATSPERHAAFEKAVTDAALAGAEVRRAGELTMLVRAGALEGAGVWTHDNADAGRRTSSTDRLVKAPLGVLWFGGESGGEIFRVAGWLGAPSPLVFGGRTVLQGYGGLYAVDVYTGRILWRTPLPAPEDPLHATRYVGYVGTDARNYCYTWAAAGDAIYLGHGESCMVFDPKTGECTASWPLPRTHETERPPYWGNMLVTGDVLVAASCTPVDLRKLPADQGKLTTREIVRCCEWLDILGANMLRLVTRTPEFMDTHLGDLLGDKPLAETYPRFKTLPVAAGMELAERIVAVDRRTGTTLWTHDFIYGCHHNSALVAGGGKVFCVDAYPREIADVLKRRGKLPADYAPVLVALDLKSGETLWTATEDVWGVGGLSYSPDHDLILQAPGRVNSNRVARKARDGSILWKKRMEGEGYGFWHPSIIHGDQIINYHGDVYDLKTGERKTIEHPLTGEPLPWRLFTRSHGCNHAVAGANLVLVRVGNAAYADLLNFCGTHSLGGFRSSCQNNLIAADGVLSVPRYSECSCAYPIFTSLGLIHDPDVEVWGFFGDFPVKGRVKRVGINLGAPGDRRGEDGTLWLDWPSVGGPSPDIPVTVEPADVEWFRHRSARFTGDGLKWVAASGCKGVRKVTVSLAPDDREEKPYRVRLHFAECDDLKDGERVFDVALQGRIVLKDLDVAREAGGTERALVREFNDIRVRKDLTITLVPSAGAKVRSADSATAAEAALAATAGPVLCGIEVTAQGW